MTLSIVLPCYQEEANIERVTRAALEVGRRAASELEVIIVDDGSTDGTRSVAIALSAEFDEVQWVCLPKNQGYGAALRRGFEAARMDWIFYTDGDGQFDIEELPRLLALLEDYDLATGYRLERSDGRLRLLYGALWTALTNAAFGLGVRDVNCAFKVFPRELLSCAPPVSEGALICAELLRGAREAGLSIGEVGVRHLPRVEGRQTGAAPRVIFKALVEFTRQLRVRSTPLDAAGLRAR